MKHSSIFAVLTLVAALVGACDVQTLQAFSTALQQQQADPASPLNHLQATLTCRQQFNSCLRACLPGDRDCPRQCLSTEQSCVPAN